MSHTESWNELIKEGPYVAEIEVEMMMDELDAPVGLSSGGTDKIERVRAALKAGDLKAAVREAKVWEAKPIDLDAQVEPDGDDAK